ncbi:polysaccharide biosynthesis protein [Streptomyces sp. CNQ085]|uniref:polysaccharide biosynthesis protein n=1 Tax=Streptomyces sp. CNQ085 TaxID=2886944 RepID=UPI001F50B198|nr:polysaccharide biosynthesis protein [Streptomyces sp. CNQ085]MCI0385671.1 polysaccharide biosynthesis protein [Streptomyces sp. CNQ085]
MNDDTVRLATVWRIVRLRWRLLAVVAVTGALVGYGTSLLFPPRYTASASVLLPGAWGERELLTQTEIATSSVVLDRAAVSLDWTGVSDGELRERVSAKVTDGNVIEISGTADTHERAQRLSDQVVREYIAFTARIAGDGSGTEAEAGPETLQETVVRTIHRITELADAAGRGQTVESVQTRTELVKLRTALQKAVDSLERAGPSADMADVVVMGPAGRPTGAVPPTRTQFVVAGALLFLLAVIVGHLAVVSRTSRRPRTEREVAAAMGSAPLGTVGVSGEPHVRRSGRWARIRRMLGLDIRWDVSAPRTSGDEADREILFQRVCSRLRDRLSAPRRLLVVVPEGDEIAFRAAGQLVAYAGSDPLLRVVEVSVSRPVLPDRDTESGALAVLSAGSLTAPELAGVSEACAEARYEVVGTVLAALHDTPGRVRTARSTGRSRKNGTSAPAVGDDAEGRPG